MPARARARVVHRYFVNISLTCLRVKMYAAGIVYGRSITFKCVVMSRRLCDTCKIPPIGCSAIKRITDNSHASGIDVRTVAAPSD